MFSLQYGCKAKAKLNLFLHVLATTEDNLHELQSLVYFPDVYDSLTFTLLNSSENTLEVSGEFSKNLPIFKDNSIYQVIIFFQETFSLKEKIQVQLQKNLPIGGGIGGGSSDTAITIIAMNDLFDLKLSFDELLQIAAKFGSDVPVCLYQSRNLLIEGNRINNKNIKDTNITSNFLLTKMHQGAIFEGKGELTNAVNIPELPILLINPKQALLTKEVFFKYDKVFTKHSQKIDELNNLTFRDASFLLNFLENTKNDLTQASISLNNNIATILESLKSSGALLSRMSGSGSTCFAIYKDNYCLEEAEKKIKILYPKFWVAISKVSTNAIL